MNRLRAEPPESVPAEKALRAPGGFKEQKHTGVFLDEIDTDGAELSSHAAFHLPPRHLFVIWALLHASGVRGR